MDEPEAVLTVVDTVCDRPEVLLTPAAAVAAAIAAARAAALLRNSSSGLGGGVSGRQCADVKKSLAAIFLRIKNAFGILTEIVAFNLRSGGGGGGGG